MDPVTHTLVGVGVANGLLRTRFGPRAVPILALAANLPDVDALVHLGGDPFAVLWRRTFGHSLLMMPIWTLLLALVLRFIFRRIRLPALWGLSVLGWCVHVLFDLINSFGVDILWPISDWRPEWAIVFIIDLILTGLLAAPLLIAWPRALRSRLPALSRIALVLTALYLVLCGAGRAAATRLLAATSAERGPAPGFTYVFPEPLGPHRWRGVEREGGVYRLTLLRVLPALAAPGAVVPTEPDDARVLRARASPRGRRLERFFKAPVWRVEGESDGGAIVRVHDLRFQSLVLNREPVFVFRFRVPPAGDAEPIPEGATGLFSNP